MAQASIPVADQVGSTFNTVSCLFVASGPNTKKHTLSFSPAVSEPASCARFQPELRPKPWIKARSSVQTQDIIWDWLNHCGMWVAGFLCALSGKQQTCGPALHQTLAWINQKRPCMRTVRPLYSSRHEMGWMRGGDGNDGQVSVPVFFNIQGIQTA